MLALLQLFDRLPSVVREVGLAGLLDIVIVTLVIYSFMVVVKRTRRSGLIFTGILITGAVYLAALKFGLKLTATLLQGFFAVILVALVVIFQEDLRYFFERVALWGVERRLPLYKRKTARLPSREVEILARTLSDLARARIGALVVVRGKDVIARHLVGGEDVDGLLSEPLLKSIFDPHSLGHDGAVIIEGNRIARLGCHLPLSKSLHKLPRSGTRHAAALGLAELSDVLCLVVSEERGTISVARKSEIYTIGDSAALAAALEAFYREVMPLKTRTPWQFFFRRNYREKAVAFAVSVLLWSALVYRSQTAHRSIAVPASFNLLPAPLSVTSCDPPAVIVTLAGQRKDFSFLKPSDVKLAFELLDAKPGWRTLPVTVRDLTFPEGLELEDIEPRQVRIQINQKPTTNGVAVPKL
jgi:diadenylate cyclase